MRQEKKLFYSSILAITLSSCASTNPYNITDDDYSILDNWIDKKNGVQTSYFFNHSDDIFLYWGLFKARGEASFKVPPGKRTVIVHIVYAPKGIWKPGVAFNLYETYARIKFNAKSSKHYRPNSTIKNSIANIWIEEVGGKIVSDVVSKQIIPYGDAYE